MSKERHLNEVLGVFESVAASLDKPEKFWEEQVADEEGYGELLRAYIERIQAVPPIDGIKMQ